ncbi:hypothetical protein Tco_0065569 [Tanacetum coccineum]
MSAITDIKCVLSQKVFDTFCEKFHIPEEVHPVLPNQSDTIHKRPTGKIGLYTRFFNFTNFRLPLSTFLVNIVRHFRINISQLSVIGAAKVSHFEILRRVYGVTPTVGLFRCFYNDNFFWVDDFACPVLFPWHTAKNVTRDPAPALADFNAHDYATLVAHPSSFRKFPEEFLCLVRLSRHYTLDEETYPRFLDKDGEATVAETTIGRVVPLLLVVPDRAESELEASVDKLFDKGGSGNQAGQGDSADFGEWANIHPVTKATNTVVEDVAPLQPRRQRKRKTMVVDAGEASHPPKTLREDHGTPSGASVGGKSRSVVQRLLVGAVLNAEVRGEPILTFLFVTSFVSATPRREGGDHTDFVSEPNFHTIGASQRFVISSDSSYHSGTNVAEAEVDSLIRSSALVVTTVTIVTPTVDTAAVAKEKPVEPSLFGTASSSASEADPTLGVYVPQWSVTNGSRLDDGRVCREMMDEFAPLKFFSSIRGMEHDQLFIEFNVGAARQMSLSAEVRMCAEYNIKEKRRLKFVAKERAELLKVREKEVEDLKAQLLLKEVEAAEAIRLRAKASKFEAVEKSLQDEVKAPKERNASLEKERDTMDVKVTGLEASDMGKDCELTDLNAQLTFIKSHNDSLVDQVHELEVSSSRLQEKLSTYENLTEQLEEFEDAQLKIVNDKFDKLYADFVEMALHLEEKFYPHLLTTISDRRCLLTYGMKLAIIKCLNSPKYLSALGAAISKDIEKGMQDGLAAWIMHGKEGRELTEVAAHNPSAEVDYVSAFLRLEDPLAEKLGLSELQPYVDQLMVPIHRSPDQVVLSASALSLALDVSSSRVRKIKENIANHRSALHDVFVPLAEPLSVTALTGTKGTYNVIPATTDTTTALSITFASASIIAPISVYDYEVVATDNQADADGNAEPFLNVDDAELNTPQ